MVGLDRVIVRGTDQPDRQDDIAAGQKHALGDLVDGAVGPGVDDPGEAFLRGSDCEFLRMAPFVGRNSIEPPSRSRSSLRSRSALPRPADGL